MLNKTLRSVLSLTMVFCLLLGVSGNAIALAVSNPAAGAIDNIDSKVNSVVADLEATIAELEKEVATQEQNLADAQGKLDSGKEDLAEAQKTLDEKKELLDEARDELNQLQGKLDEADEMLGKLEEKAAEYQAQLDDAQVELEKKQAAYDKAIADGVPAEALADAKAELVEAKKQWEDADKKLKDTLVQLADAHEQVAWAKGEYQKLYDTIDEIEGTINNYQAKVDEANAAVVKAEDALPKAEVALVEAKEALADAKTLVENVKATYATLHNAVTNPEVSLEFVRETVATLNAQINELWASALTLQTSLHELIAAYEELEGFAIDPIVIEDYYFAGLVIEPFEVDEYHYEEVGFHFAGYKFDGYTVDAVTVEGYTFEGFTAPEMPAQLTQISNTLDNVIAKVTTLNEAVRYYVAAAKPVLAKALNVAEEALGITYTALKNNLNKATLVKVYNWLYNNPDVVCGLVKEFGVFGLDLLVKYGPYALDLMVAHPDLVVLGMKATVLGAGATVTLGAKALGYVGDKLDFLADYKDDVTNAVKKLYAKYGDEAKALVEVYVDYLQLRERYENATHADYTIFHDSLFVAIGDGTALPGGYTDKLAEMLEIPHMSENLAQIDMTIAEAIELVKQEADLLGKADMITLGFSNIIASRNMLNALNGEEVTDWSAAVGETAGDAIAAGLVELKAILVEEGLDEETVNMVLDAVNAYAYAYAARIMLYPELVKTVREVNADALIVVVGTYNDLEGVVVDVNGREVNVGKYAQYLMYAANLENLLQAMFSEGVLYVSANQVETVFEENAYENLNNLGYLMSILNDEMLPSDNGHAYIAEQIYNALNVEYKIYGDVNGDRIVNCRDARLILKYAAGLITEDELDLTWGDVNGDGKVNSRDARLILQLRAGQIEHFPVCGLYEE